MKNLTRFSLLSAFVTTGILTFTNTAWGQAATGDTQMEFTANLAQECSFIATDGTLDYKPATQYQTLTTEDGNGEQGIYAITCNAATGTLQLTTFTVPNSADFTDATVAFDNGSNTANYEIDNTGTVALLDSDLALSTGDNTINVSVEANFDAPVDASNPTDYDLSIVADVAP
jgi:hypothetical protein